MPGRLKPQSYERLNSMYTNHEMNIIRHPLPAKTKLRPKMDNRISYIPSQMDPLASTSTRAVRQNPLWLLMQDAGVLIKMLPYLPNIVLPIKASNDSCELNLGLSNIRDIILQSLLFIFESALLCLAIPAMLFLPGGISLIIAALCCSAIYTLAWPMQGPRVSCSKMDDDTVALAEEHKDERWLFINGCATSHANLQKNIDRLAHTFGRAVIGIHNKTYGLTADILECLIQRCFSYNTMDVRVTYGHVKAVLADPTVNKVVLIGHSQGGIIISLVLDHLFSELPAVTMSKLEIYTFGSAASHFSNPLLSFDPTPLSSPSPKTKIPNAMTSPAGLSHVIQHIEHYANEYDMIPRWGVLHCVRSILNNRYYGNVFVRMRASGHLFNQHYMEPMFPGIPQEGQTTGIPPWSALDAIASVEDKLALKRESTALMNAGMMRDESGLEFGNGQVLENEADVNGAALNGGTTNGMNGHSKREHPIMVFSRNSTGVLHAKEAEGKSMRQLSRLWRYQGGQSPDDDPMGMLGAEGQWLNRAKVPTMEHS